MGFGDKVQVLEPVELKALLKQKAEEILSIY
jgi:predicted DNA-binding transcriptional regulator YafY